MLCTFFSAHGLGRKFNIIIQIISKKKKKIDLNDISKTDVDDYGNDESGNFLDKEECKKDEDGFINNNNLAWCLWDKYLQNIVLTKFRYLFSIIYLFPKLFSEICPFSEAFENSKNYKKN